MAILSKGTDFSTGDQVTAANLDALVDSATFAAGAVDDSTTALDSSTPKKIIVKNEGIGTTQLADDAVTAAKIAAGALTDVVYPIGSIFTTVTNYANSAAVVTAIGGTTWTAFGAGRVLVGLDSSDTDFDAVEETGGAKTHTLTLDEMPAHDHVPNRDTFGTNNLVLRRNANGTNTTDATDTSVGEPDISASNLDFPEIEGGGGSHNNLQPYIVVYMWKRTA